MAQKTTENKIDKITIGCIILFLFPFLLIGIWTLYSSLNKLYLQNKAKNWIPIEAEIKNVEFISVRNAGSRGNSFETKCTYTYTFKSKKHTSNIISIGYNRNNTEKHRELYDLLRYVNKITAYVNPTKPNDSTLIKGTNSSTISLLIFSILWNSFILVFFKYKNKKLVIAFVLFFIFGLATIIFGVYHTDFEKRINIIDKKSIEEIKETERKQFEESIQRYENTIPIQVNSSPHN